MTFGRDLTEDQKKQIVPKTNVSNEVLVRIKYEKLKNWQTVKKEIQSLLDNPDWIETAITLVYGPQLVYTMRHPRIVQSMTHFKTSLYDMFTTQYKSGNDQEFGVWLLGNRDGNISTKHARFSTSSVVTALTFVSKHGVYLAFTQDLFLKVFTDRFVEVYKIFWLTTVLCLVYNKVLDEIYIGGIGLLEIWKIKGTEHAAVPVLVKKCDVTLTEDDWVQEIKFDNNLDLLYAMCGMGIVVFNTKTQKQVHYLTSTLLGTLRSFCLYTRDEYIVTGEMDGSIKVWGSNVFSQVHQFHDHCEAVTALNVHRCDPLLFSSSLDGVLFIWRMDNFCKYMRLDLGEKIYKMKLISDTLFFCQIEKEIKIFSLNQFYQMFAPVESDIFKLVCSRGMGKSSKIVCSTQDGSVRLISPESGQTYTIMYPLSSFQVMTQVAYDVHQSRLHIVLSDGSILINNCLTNPCQMEEIWSSEFEDEQIMEITMVIVMYSSGENEDGYQIDHLLFAGLQNGQIILADAFISTLEEPHQAHEGKIICLDSGARVDKSGCAVDPCSQILISGGTDGFVCVWQIHVTERARQLLIHLTSLVRIDIGSVPVYCCMSENILAVVHVHHAGNEDNWLLTMYHMKKWDVKNSHCNDIEILTHCVSEDHGTKITALDKCPVLGLFLTCGEDSYLKIWNSKNQLIREMSFGQPLYAACFANDRGDILFGFQKHLCSISIASYLPLDYLETVVKFDFKDSEYEYPLQFDVHITPGLELVNVQKYPQQLSERRSLKLEKKIVSQIKKIYEEKQSEKFRIYIIGAKSVGNYFAGKLKEFACKKLIRKEKIKEHAGKELAVATIGDRLKEAHRRKVDFEEEGEEDIGLKGKALAIARIVNRLRRAPKRKVVNFEEFERNSSSEVLCSDEDGEVNRYSLEDELKLLVKNVSVDNTHLSILSHYKMRIELEDKLYKRDPIIARDGYIPNSVIRKKLNPPPSPPPSPKKPWTLKPVPKPDRRHMPEYWEPEDDSVSSEEDKCLEVMEDESEQNTVPSSERSSYERDYSRFSKRRGVPNTPPILPQSPKDVYESRGLYTIKPQTFPFQNINRIQEKSIRRGQSDEEKKPTSAVIQPSAAEPPADLQPTEKLENEMEDSEFLRQLQQGLLSLDGEINLELLLQQLLKYLNHPDINIQQRVMEWLCIIQEKKGIPDVYREQVVAQIIEKVNTTPLSRVKMFSIESLAFVGYQRADCITQMLINMADQSEDVQIAACEGLAHITGVRDKDALIQKLDVMGITGVYNSKEDEEQAMSLLGDKFGTEKDEYFQQRIRKWIESASPSSAMNHFKADEIEDMLHQQHGSWEEIQILAHHGHVRREQHLSMYPDGGTSRSTDRLKELSFLSDEMDQNSGMWSPTTKKQKIHTTDTEYTRKTQGYETGSVGSAVKKGTMKTQGFETGSAESSVKRSHLTNPKALSMYKYYDQRHLREQSGSQGSEEMKKEPDLLRGGRLDPDRLKDKSLKPELNKRTLSFASADFFLKPEFIMHKSSFSSAELSTKHESMMHKSGFPNADVSTKSEYVMHKSSFPNADMLTKPELMMHKSSYFNADMLTKPEIIIHKPSFANVDVSTSPEFRKHKSSFTSISKHRRISQYDVMPQTDLTNLGKSDGNNLKDMSTKPELSELSEHKLSFAVNDVSAKPEFRKRKSSISSTDRSADNACRKRKLSLAYASEKRRMSQADQMPFTDQMIKEGQEESGIGINVPQEESDIQSVAASLLSQEQSAGDAVSTQDSGISRDMSSDFSHERKAKLVAMTSHKSSRLSPVKSVTGLETSMRHGSTVENSAQTSTMEEGEAQIKKEGDWRQFFQLPTAMERRRMNQVKKEKAAGKLRQTHLPPISYFTENLPMLPGEAGMRLLQTVRIGEKVPVDGDHRYRVESLPGKLAVHTQNEDAGLSNFGILQMQWTTGVPNFQSTVSIPPSPPVVPRNSHRYGQHQLSNTKDYFHRFRPSIEDLSSFLPHLMGQGQTTQSHSKNYEWEHPLPPPPEKESRINVTNMKKDHDNYCKYYKLVKKQLHFYTSKHPEDLRLPEVVVKQADMVSPKKDNVPKQKSNVSKSRSNVMLPPIKLGQLVKVV